MALSEKWGTGVWTRPPRRVRAEGDGLHVEAEEGSDFWLRTLYGFEHDDGHALLASTSPADAVEVSFDLAGLSEQYDQAGLFVRAGPDRWIKAGVEISDGMPHAAVVVTSGASDWSMAPVPAWRGTVTVRFSRLGDAAVLRARTDEEGWRTIRVAPSFGDLPLQAGPMLCAPTRAGLEVTFRSWRHAPADTELHRDPPT